MIENPNVSILMTAYNREQYIAGAIESVLASTYTNFELIIVDDGSKDNTVNIAQTYAAKDARIKVFVNEQNLGDYPNRNKAASYATGTYLKYLDADDEMTYYGLDVLVNYMERFPEAGFGLASKPEDERPFPILITAREAYLEHFYGYGHFHRSPGSAIIRRSAFEECGGFSGKRFVGDYELWFKLARYYSMVKLPFETYWNRLHAMQESKHESVNKDAVLLRKTVLEDALQHPDCPLTKEEIQQVRAMVKKQAVKSRVLHFISRVAKKAGL
ncbi:MAG: glycosyltransferase family 2 protein [Chitinophagaceae bacterium]|nr:glycosyltransferase family 2 protein [Chitinophagaceae bacterium]